jgi:hypothetical protein
METEEREIETQKQGAFRGHAQTIR